MLDRSLKRQTYVVSVEKKDGTLAFVRKGETDTRVTIALTSDPAFANQFDLDTPKEEILDWIDQITGASAITRNANPTTLRVMIFETQLFEISEDDYDWKVELQRNGVGKLTRAEVLALGLEKFEIERKMARS
jgi:hypothetical protein